MAKQDSNRDSATSVDEDWPEQAPVPATQSSITREIKLQAPGGVITPVTIADLKQLSFNDYASSMPLVAVDEAVGEDQFGPILESAAKGKLCGVPLIVAYWEFHDGDMGEFASLYIITQSNDRFIVNDGSTGIYQQLRNYTDRTGSNTGLACPNGFRVSEYDKEIQTPTGTRTTHAKTYYLEAGSRVSA